RLISARRRVAMRSEPRNGRIFYKPRRDASHLPVRVDPGSRALQHRRDVGWNIRWRRAWLKLNFSLLPLPVVPLSDEPGPMLNRHLHSLISNTKRNVLIA